MNSLNSSSIDTGVGTAIAGAERKGEVKTGASEVGKICAGILATGVALGLTDGGEVVFCSEGTELLEWRDLSDPLADLIGPAEASLLATI